MNIEQIRNEYMRPDSPRNVGEMELYRYDRPYSDADEATQLAAIKSYNGHHIYFMRNPSEAVKLAAVAKDGTAIKEIDNPSMQVRSAAIKQNPLVITEIPNPTLDEVMLALVGKWNPEDRRSRIEDVCKHIVKHLDNPSEDTLVKLATRYPVAVLHISSPSETLVLTAVEKYPLIIRDLPVEFVSKAARILAVSNDGTTLKFIADPSDDEILAAVTNWGPAIQHVANPSESLQRIAVSNHIGSIGHIKAPSMEIRSLALSHYPEAIQYIKNPTESEWLQAVTANPRAIRCAYYASIHPSHRVIEAAYAADPRCLVYMRPEWFD